MQISNVAHSPLHHEPRELVERRRLSRELARLEASAAIDENQRLLLALTRACWVENERTVRGSSAPTAQLS